MLELTFDVEVQEVVVVVEKADQEEYISMCLCEWSLFVLRPRRPGVVKDPRESRRRKGEGV